MRSMPTLHVRNVPVELYEELRQLAEKDGRSINAAAIDLLADALGERRKDDDWWEEFLELRSRVHLPPDAPRPEDLIREDRDSR
jgi:plasmid stability protein